MSDAGEPIPLDPTKLVVAMLSDPGRVRTENQDSAVALSNVSNERLLVVADGMGGHRGGETASKLCVDTLARAFRDPHGTPAERLRRGLELANEEVYGHALSNPELKGMGTTAVALLLGSGTRGVWLAWVGDSRCYRLRAGALELLTKDHSLIAEWIAMGVIKPEEAESHPRRHDLTRAIGQSPDVVVDVVRVDVQAGDRFLLCSDGVHSPVPDRALKAALASPPEEAARVLIERANANGGPDNATVVIAEIPPEAVTADAIEQPPEVPLELELPSPPPPPPAAAPPAPAPEESLELEPTAHSSAAIDAALAELEAARGGADLGPALDPDPSGSELPQMFEPTAAPAPVARAAPSAPEPEPSAESSFADLMDDEPSESPASSPAPLTPPAAEFGSAPAPPFGSPSFDSPSLVAPTPSREIRIPLMTPVRARRGLHAPSVLAGLVVGLLVVAAAAGAWLYGGMSHWKSEPAPAPERTAARPAPKPRPAPAPQRESAPAAPPAAVARAVTPPPELAPTPSPAPAVTPQLPAPVPAPVPAPAPAAVPAPTPAPTPIAMPDAPRPAPTTVVIVRPQTPPPAATVPASPDGSPTAPPLPTAAGFELAPPVRRFVDDWLRAQETHDSQLFASLGFRGVPTELAGTWSTRDAYRLKAASVDEERSTSDLVYLRVVVSYAFRDGTGRFRTEDEERMILRSSGGKLLFEGRWQQ